MDILALLIQEVIDRIEECSESHKNACYVLQTELFALDAVKLVKKMAQRLNIRKELIREDEKVQ